MLLNQASSRTQLSEVREPMTQTLRYQRACFTALFLFITILSLQAQYVEEEASDARQDSANAFQNRFFTGGGFGFQFGTVTLFQVSPMLGYRVTPRLNAGAGLSYLYYRDQIARYSSSIYGYSLFSQFHVVQGIFLHSEFNRINYTPYSTQSPLGVNAFLVGAGYNTAMATGRSGFYLMLLWNVLTSPYYPYQNPILRGGLQFGF